MSYVHHTAWIDYPPMHREHRTRAPNEYAGVRIADGARIEAYVIVEKGIWEPTSIGDSWIMHRVLIGHDAFVGDGCEIASGSNVSAHAKILDGAKLGVGTTVRIGVTVGRGARTGCGAVVVKDIPDGETHVGNPARRLRPSPPPPEAATEPGPPGVLAWSGADGGGER